jgi:hypothetical protein
MNKDYEIKINEDKLMSYLEEYHKKEDEKINRFKIKSYEDYEIEINNLLETLKMYPNNNDIDYDLCEVVKEYEEYKKWTINQVKKKIVEKVRYEYDKNIKKEIRRRLRHLKENNEDYEDDIIDFDYDMDYLSSDAENNDD